MEQNTTPRFAFGPRNYRLMFIGLAVLAAGFITMTLDKEDYGEGFLGITLGPILLAIGFLIEFWAIMLNRRLLLLPATWLRQAPFRRNRCHPLLRPPLRKRLLTSANLPPLPTPRSTSCCACYSSFCLANQ
ncbi:DUF3098 domain-containing protein [Hymenobacter sp. AT01-02]|uniref:DUF3098 domain-containing protein n=1 Tax=Hymenobacter sp. AT01-02 TaxID=1571877 RepID=UPI00092E7000|nr:DUF3098 domain-containing protein [Hymenobacter sp. AT01-02]